ncbi:MAG: septum formation initiator family protein [Acidobacteriales bacterium]|nr:septum formation initiator family protein [Terriglobales bacterium]
MKPLLHMAGWLYRSRRKLATMTVVMVTGLLAYHAAFGDNGMVVYTEKRSEHRKLDQDIQSLQQENQRLQQHIDSLRTDPKSIEKEAREQLHYARPGEVVYTVPDAQPRPAAATAKK